MILKSKWLEWLHYNTERHSLHLAKQPTLITDYIGVVEIYTLELHNKAKNID